MKEKIYITYILTHPFTYRPRIHLSRYCFQSEAVWPDYAIYWTLGNFSKPWFFTGHTGTNCNIDNSVAFQVPSESEGTRKAIISYFAPFADLIEASLKLILCQCHRKVGPLKHSPYLHTLFSLQKVLKIMFKCKGNFLSEKRI